MVRSTLKATSTGGLETVVPGDDAWPCGFDALGDRAPLALWAKGDTGLLTAALSGLVTITGARAATSYGEHVAGVLAADLAAKGRIVVSGAAYGIDGTAHRAALAADRPTIAFLAGGADRAYPMGHQDLLDRIARNGVVVSEMPPGATPTRWRFTQRARLPAAVSSAPVICGSRVPVGVVACRTGDGRERAPGRCGARSGDQPGQQRYAPARIIGSP